MRNVDLVKVMAELDEDLVIQGVTEQMADGTPAIEILAQL